MSNTKVKRGPGRPKGSKNKVKSISNVVKRGRGRPKGSKNKTQKPKEEFISLPFTNPTTAEERIANIGYMASLYQYSDGRRKNVSVPKKRGRKPKLDLMDDNALVKGDVDSDHFMYTDRDIQEELHRTEAYQDFVANQSRYSESF